MVTFSHHLTSVWECYYFMVKCGDSMSTKQIDQNIIDKIKKLFDHHEGCMKINSIAEAMASMELAKKLMEKHHLDMMTFKEYSCSEEDITHKKVDKCSVYKVPLWMTNLINMVNNICCSECILQKEKQSNGYIHINVVFVSQKTDINRVFEMYTFYKKMTYKFSNNHVKHVEGNYKNWRSFAEGFTSKLLERSRTYYGELNNVKDSMDACNLSDFNIDSEFEESEDETEVNQNNDVVSETSITTTKEKSLQLHKYLAAVKEKIQDYINSHITNTKTETIDMKSKVFVDSYNLGVRCAEEQNIHFCDKSHQLETKKERKQ